MRSCGAVGQTADTKMAKGYSDYNMKFRPCKTCGQMIRGSSHERLCSIPLPDRFWKDVQKGDGCWLYMKGIKPEGYRFFRYRITPGKQTQWYAHRYSWTITYGEIPDGKEVAHKCDNRGCVRPDHLFLATHDENMKDCAVKGRYPVATLKPEQVRRIRVALRKPYRGLQKNLAKQYGVLPGVICDIKMGYTYQYVV